MRLFVLTMAGFMLGACPEVPEAAATATAEARCEPALPATGTRISRHSVCATESTSQSRDEAKQQAEAMRDHQNLTRSRLPAAPGSPAGR
jgi:hypothetical protein